MADIQLVIVDGDLPVSDRKVINMTTSPKHAGRGGTPGDKYSTNLTNLLNWALYLAMDGAAREFITVLADFPTKA